MTVPTDRYDGADPGVERYLRDTFTGDAGRAPLPDDLAGEARRIDEVVVTVADTT